MTYDDLMETRYEKQEREYIAEQTRVRAEARTSFTQIDALAIARRVANGAHRRRLAADRRAQVSHARAVVAALAGFTYDGCALGGAQ